MRRSRLRALTSVTGAAFTAVANLQVGTSAAGPVVTTLDDRSPQFVYTGAWQSCTNCGADLFAGTNSWDNIANDFVTVTFTGTQIRLYGVRDPRHGTGMVSIDGGPETAISFNAATRQGNVLLFTSPTLSPGTHTFRLRVAGPDFVVPDRVDIVS